MHQKTAYIKDIAVGSKIKEFFMLKDFVRRETKAGKLFMSFEAADKSGTIKGVKWTVDEAFLSRLEKGKVYGFQATVGEYNNEKQMVCDQIGPLTVDDIDMACFVPASRYSPVDMLTKVFDILNTIQEPHLKQLIKSFENDATIMGGFKQSPAAKAFHHAYVSGLLEHVLSCLQVADLLCTHYRSVNRDLLLTGVFLHDIGKIRELSSQGNFEYSDEGRLVGHIVIASELVDRKILELSDFPVALMWQLKHMILSHHGELEYGSPVVPKTLEAQLLHAIDNMDAKINMFECAQPNGSNEDQGWVFSKPLGRHVVCLNPQPS